MIGVIQKRVMRTIPAKEKVYVKVTIGLTRKRRIRRRVKLIDDFTKYDLGCTIWRTKLINDFRLTI